MGAQPWAGVSPSDAIQVLRGTCVHMFVVFCEIAIQELRGTLEFLRVPEAKKYGTHDFRRGHAKVGRCHVCTLVITFMRPLVCRTCRMRAHRCVTSVLLASGPAMPSSAMLTKTSWREMLCWKQQCSPMRRNGLTDSSVWEPVSPIIDGLRCVPISVDSLSMGSRRHLVTPLRLFGNGLTAPWCSRWRPSASHTVMDCPSQCDSRSLIPSLLAMAAGGGVS